MFSLAKHFIPIKNICSIHEHHRFLLKHICFTREKHQLLLNLFIQESLISIDNICFIVKRHTFPSKTYVLLRNKVGFYYKHVLYCGSSLFSFETDVSCTVKDFGIVRMLYTHFFGFRERVLLYQIYYVFN